MNGLTYFKIIFGFLKLNSKFKKNRSRALPSDILTYKLQMNTIKAQFEIAFIHVLKAYDGNTTQYNF